MFEFDMWSYYIGLASGVLLMCIGYAVYKFKEEGQIMKKIILILLMVFSLNANELMCDDSWDRYMKQYNLFEVARKRSDVLSMKIRAALSIAYIEETITECGDDWEYKETAEGIREEFFNVSEVLEKYQQSVPPIF